MLEKDAMKNVDDTSADKVEVQAMENEEEQERGMKSPPKNTTLDNKSKKKNEKKEDTPFFIDNTHSGEKRRQTPFSILSSDKKAKLDTISTIEPLSIIGTEKQQKTATIETPFSVHGNNKKKISKKLDFNELENIQECQQNEAPSSFSALPASSLTHTPMTPMIQRSPVYSTPMVKEGTLNTTDIIPMNVQAVSDIARSLGDMVKNASGKEAVQFLSLYVDAGLTKKDAEEMTGRNIHGRLWAKARRHCNYPGPGKQVVETFWKNHRKRIGDEQLIEFMEWLRAADLIQNLSYGQKVVQFSNGRHVAIESVKRTDLIRNIVKKYYEFMESRGEEENATDDVDDVDDDEIPNLVERSPEGYDSESDDDDDEFETEIDFVDDDRCSATCAKTSRRCLLHQNHNNKDGRNSRHKFTPRHMLSPSTIEKLLKTLTSGGIKSRAGLDNIDVEKGHENFEAMKNLIDTMCTMLGDDNKKKTLKEKVEGIVVFHKVHFERHLKEKSNRHSCMCLHCGFYSTDDPIQCPNDHCTVPCQDCQDSFAIFGEMNELFEEVQERCGDNESQPWLQDDILFWGSQIKNFSQNLRDYRAHLADKVSEANFDHKDRDLGEGEALVVIDYKMKVLPRMFREKMKDWYSKRGISILGVEIHIIVNGERKVFYHFFISDDVNQDAEAVLCAKHFLYSKVLPRYGIKTVKFRCDGAGCFSSQEAKSSMKLWDDLARNTEANDNVFCYETAYKVMVAGCGKTALDGMFGIMTMHLIRLVNCGNSFNNADELFRLLAAYPLHRSYYHRFEPDRELLVWPKASKDLHLKQFHHLKLDSKNGEVIGKIHSDLSTDIFFTLDKTDGFARKKLSMLQYDHIPISEQNATKDPCVHVKETSFPHDSSTEELLSMLTNAPSRDPRSIQERILEQTKDRINKSENLVSEKWKKYKEEMKMSGYLCCPETDGKTMDKCTCIFRSEKALQKHIAQERHVYPPVDLETNLHLLHLEGKIAFCLATGTMTNRSEIADTRTYTIRKGVEMSSHEKWFSKGCYNPSRGSNFQASEALLKDLNTLFFAGFETENREKSAANKYTAAQALTYLANLKIQNGRRKYSCDPQNTNGQLPTQAYIKGWFSRKANDLKQEALASNGDFTQLTKSKLKEFIRKKFQLVKVTEKAVLIRLLQISYRMQTGEELDCTGKTLGEMKEECENLGIPIEGRDSWVHLLNLNFSLEKLQENSELMNVVRDTRRKELVCERGDN